MKNKKYLVTGGTGFIGSALVIRLVKDGFGVRVLDSNLRGSRDRLESVGENIEYVGGDIRDKETVEKACSGVDGVIHLAYLNGTEFFYKHPDLVLDIGVKGIVNVVDACIKQNIKELIVASSSEVYQSPKKIPTDETAELVVPDPLNPRYSYGSGKIISEMITINFGRKYFDRAIIFRPHNVYGPDMGWEHVIPQFVLRMKELCEKTNDSKINFPIQGDGKETRAFIFIDDFIDGLMLVMDKGEHLGIYHIGTEEELPISNVAEEIGNYFKREINLIPGKPASGGTSRRCPDITKIKKLGFSQKVKFADGIKVTSKWYDENYSKKKEILKN
jgi:nucleoside-diphosphate-sugar epimerase